MLVDISRHLVRRRMDMRHRLVLLPTICADTRSRAGTMYVRTQEFKTNQSLRPRSKLMVVDSQATIRPRSSLYVPLKDIILTQVYVQRPNGGGNNDAAAGCCACLAGLAACFCLEEICLSM